MEREWGEWGEWEQEAPGTADKGSSRHCKYVALVSVSTLIMRMLSMPSPLGPGLGLGLG